MKGKIHPQEASHDRERVNKDNIGNKPDKCFAYPMFFNDAHVASFLNRYGYVYTVRQRIKRRLPEKRIAVKHIPGGQWTHEQLGYFVQIYPVCEKVEFVVLTKYLPESGFDKIEDWIRAITGFNKRKGLENIALYKAVRE